MNKNKKVIIGIIALVMVTAAVSFGVSLFVFYGWGLFNPKYEISFDTNSVSAENIKKFEQVRNLLKDMYYEDVNENTLLEGAVAGMASSLKDPYTTYYTKQEMDRFLEETSGSIVGIGAIITINSSGIFTIVETMEGSPARKAGLMQGDMIRAVDNKDVSGVKDLETLVSQIKGEKDTQVKLSVYRPSESKFYDFTITRDKVKVVNIKSELLEGNIGYIKIIEFDEEMARYFESHLSALLSRGMKGLIIDLRDDPGGAYDQVVAIADRLLPKGLIVYTEDKQKRKEEQNSDAKELGLPMVVLVNENSASASEILAGAIKDNNKGTLVGTKTFGKGLVQRIIGLDDGSGLKVTIARYFTPSGVCIQGIGIQPDIEVQLPEKYKGLPVTAVPRDEDTQFKKALEVIKEKIK